MGFTAQLIEVVVSDQVKFPVAIKAVNDIGVEAKILPVEIVRKILSRYATEQEINDIVGWLASAKANWDITKMPSKLKLDSKIRFFGDGWTSRKVFKMYVEDHYGI